MKKTGMKKTRTKKINAILLGTIVAIGTPIGVVASINAAIGKNKKNYVAVASNQQKIMKPLTADQLIDKILEGELDLLDLKVKDFVKVIEALKNDQPNQLKAMLEHSAPGILEKIKTIDTATFRLAFDLILNKGILNLSQANIFEVEKVIKLFIKKQEAPWWLEFIKYIPVILHEGLNKLFSENSKPFFDQLKPQLVSLVAKKIITKLDNETAIQQQVRAKQVATLKVELMTIAKALPANNNHEFFQDFVPQFANLGAKKIIEQLPTQTVAQQQARQKKEAKLQTDITSMTHQLFRDHTNEVFNKIMPQIVNRVVQKIIIKPRSETTAQQRARAIKAAALQKDLLKLARKFLINGFSSKDEMATDVTNLIYQVTDKIPKVYKLRTTTFFGLIKINRDIKVAPIVKSAIFNIIKSLTIPSKEHIEKEIKNASQNIKKLEENNSKLAQEIRSLATKITTTTKAKGDLESTYKDLKVKLDAFQANHPYSDLMFQLGINNDVLADANKFSSSGNRHLRAKWYESEYKAYWVLARMLWHKYLDQNNDYDSKEDWYSKVLKDWKYGVTSWSWGSWSRVETNNPDHKRLDSTIRSGYSKEALDSLVSKWKEIQKGSNQKLIKENQGHDIMIPPFSRNDILKIQKYEDMSKQLTNLQSSKAKKAKAIKNNQVKIKSLKLKREALKISPAYVYENKHKITRDILNKNEFFKGKGFLKLSPNDVSNILYKVQDLFLNIRVYLDIALDDTIEGAFSSVPFGSIIVIFLKSTIKSQVNDLLNPLLEKYLTPELITKIKTIDAKQISQALDGIINKGLAKTDDGYLLALILLIKKFIVIQLSDQDLFNIIMIAKKGLNALPKSSKVATLYVIIDLIKMPDIASVLIKSLIKK